MHHLLCEKNCNIICSNLQKIAFKLAIWTIQQFLSWFQLYRQFAKTRKLCYALPRPYWLQKFSSIFTSIVAFELKFDLFHILCCRFFLCCDHIGKTSWTICKQKWYEEILTKIFSSSSSSTHKCHTCLHIIWNLWNYSQPFHYCYCSVYNKTVRLNALSTKH